MKKICLIIPTNRAGGMERVMYMLANYFASIENITVFFITYTTGSGFYDINNRVKMYNPSFSLEKNNKFIYSLKLLIYLRRQLSLLKPDAVLSFGEMYNSFVLLAAYGLKLNVYVSDRSKPDKKWGLFHEALRKIIYKSAKGIISQTEYSKKYLHQIIKHKNIALIPNPILLKKNKYGNKNVILNVGRLIKSKKIDILIHIFSKVKHEGWELWIIGDGPERKYLEEVALKLNLSEHVKFFGMQKNIEYFYERAGIFAFTSVSEGFPNSLLEAISFGIPCISFNCTAGPSDLINDGINGYLIPELNIDLYIEKLQKLILDEKLRLLFSKNAKTTSENYNLEKIGKNFLSFLK